MFDNTRTSLLTTSTIVYFTHVRKINKIKNLKKIIKSDDFNGTIVIKLGFFLTKYFGITGGWGGSIYLAIGGDIK